ncbi:predicted protein [Sclerotinia sclerotiorum 1980 UF-70]|uniref:Uncharacterized protein n=1 Tax=Sclerotinia sclerotiorum (strain ATCC 18683 / 1980 / Ss-1) TaxID=665079 RepID=A7EDV6_SCLS1|nr:predicted protein [Sclerotinia sclerotiorum 1980 UF-70]EDO01022.1 predicted protein [Sclerotinia sclerotiorum 1980 UF-70]
MGHRAVVLPLHFKVSWKPAPVNPIRIMIFFSASGDVYCLLD